MLDDFIAIVFVNAEKSGYFGSEMTTGRMCLVSLMAGGLQRWPALIVDQRPVS